MRFLTRSLIGLFMLALTAGLVAVAGTMVWRALETRWADDAPSRPARERVFAVNVLTVESGTVRPVITSFGEIRSRRTLELRAPAAGEIVWLSEAFEEGAAVTAGQELVRIDDADARKRPVVIAASLRFHFGLSHHFHCGAASFLDVLERSSTNGGQQRHTKGWSLVSSRGHYLAAEHVGLNLPPQWAFRTTA